MSDETPIKQPQEEQLTKKQRLEKKRQEKMKELERELKKQTYKKVIIGIVLLAIIGGIIAIVIAGKSNSGVEIDKSPDPAKGASAETAKVVIKEYSDFQCPGCAGAYPAVRDLMKEYGDQVRFQYNDFPLLGHEYAKDAAIAGQCAFEQGKFFELHDTLFDNQKTWGASENQAAAQDYFTEYAQQVGLDMNAFATCVTSDAAADRVNEDLAEGRSLRITQTPTFFVNDKRVTDAPFSVSLRKAIDEALAQ